MIIFKSTSNTLNRIYVQEYQLSIHPGYYAMEFWNKKRGICWGYKMSGMPSKRYLSELESTLNETKRKQDDNN